MKSSTTGELIGQLDNEIEGVLIYDTGDKRNCEENRMMPLISMRIGWRAFSRFCSRIHFVAGRQLLVEKTNKDWIGRVIKY
jgi:hypothetical protein